VHLPGRLSDFAAGELSLPTMLPRSAAAFPSRPFDAADLVAWCAVFCNPQRILLDAPPPTYDEGRELFEQIVDFEPRRARTDGGVALSQAGPRDRAGFTP
jgi:hypothetical protein